VYRIVNSHYGYALRGIHDNERRMQALGYNTWLYKYTSYIMAGIFGGVAGVLFAYFGGVMVPGNMGMAMTDIVFLLVVLGSASVFLGPVIGAIVVVGVEYLASVYMPDRWPLIMGALIVFAIMVIPQGLGVVLLNLWRKVSHGSAA
jgi:branched-chain amino acid transport system permease protein